MNATSAQNCVLPRPATVVTTPSQSIQILYLV